MRWLIVLLCMAPAAASADTFRWVDEDGVVNYSDTPHPGAERVELGGIATTRFAGPARPADAKATGGQSTDAAGGTAYQSVSIQRPQPDETLWNLEGRLDVQVSVEPNIQAGDRLKLYLDGQEVVGIPAGATSFTIDKVFRGMHTLRATVQGSGGQQLAGSETIRFYVRQTSVQNPQGPPRPTPFNRPRG
jgi:hypothetical protein